MPERQPIEASRGEVAGDIVRDMIDVVDLRGCVVVLDHESVTSAWLAGVCIILCAI